MGYCWASNKFKEVTKFLICKNNYYLKLLFTQDALINAGTERSNLDLISKFSREIDASLVYFYPRHELKEQYQGAGIRLFFLEIPEKYHLILGVRSLVQLIRKEKPDLLVSSLWRADIITRLASLITGVPLVGTLVNDSYSKMAWKDKSGFKHQIVYWLDRITASIPKYWIANAQALADSHVKTLGLDKDIIKVVYRGRNVPEEFWSKDILPEIGLRRDMPSAKYDQDLGSGSPAFNFISYGRLLERKGFQDSINAFAEVLLKYPNCTLTIFGEGTYRSHLEALIAKLGLNGKVILPGKFGSESYNYQSSMKNDIATSSLGTPRKDDPESPNPLNLSSLNPLNLLMAADCFLFPSWYEGFSGALVEAMMAGIPIIASNIPMNLEAVSPDNSLIFEVQNTDQLAQQMIFAIEHPDLMLKLGDNARKEAFKRFDIEKIAKQYEETLKGFFESLKN